MYRLVLNPSIVYYPLRVRKCIKIIRMQLHTVVWHTCCARMTSCFAVALQQGAVNEHAQHLVVLQQNMMSLMSSIYILYHTTAVAYSP